MKRLIFVFISVCFFANSYCQVLQQKLDDYMQALSKHSGFNGVVLVAKNGTILLEKGYGFREAATKVNHTENSVFQIGSVTKQFTAAIILGLEKEGKLSVKDKLSKYFPEYAHASKITVEDLLHHVSGIYNYTNDKDFMQNRVTQPLTEAAFWNLIKDKPLDFEPGTQYNYSNSGYSILGYIIRKVSKQPYETIVRQRIFQVAGMTHSGFDFTNFSSPEKSTGYSLFNKETAIPAPIVDSTVAYSAGAIFSTVRDLYKWNPALNSGKIISAADLERAYKPYKQNYGYGVGIDSIFGKRRISHGGGIHGFVSYL
ncbi:MAG TPA: serine hydrolase domain-containing protein, partial [Segetibacter sp.]